jgi:hypothetical protein
MGKVDGFDKEAVLSGRCSLANHSGPQEFPKSFFSGLSVSVLDWFAGNDWTTDGNKTSKRAA